MTNIRNHTIKADPSNLSGLSVNALKTKKFPFEKLPEKRFTNNTAHHSFSDQSCKF